MSKSTVKDTSQMTELDKELMPFYRWVWKHVNRPKYLRWMNVFSSFTFDCGLCTNSYLHPNPEIMSSVLRMHFEKVVLIRLIHLILSLFYMMKK